MFHSDDVGLEGWVLGGRLPASTCPSMGLTSLKPPGTEMQSGRRRRGRPCQHQESTWIKLCLKLINPGLLSFRSLSGLCFTRQHEFSCQPETDVIPLNPCRDLVSSHLTSSPRAWTVRIRGRGPAAEPSPFCCYLSPWPPDMRTYGWARARLSLPQGPAGIPALTTSTAPLSVQKALPGERPHRGPQSGAGAILLVQDTPGRLFPLPSEGTLDYLYELTRQLSF